MSDIFPLMICWFFVIALTVYTLVLVMIGLPKWFLLYGFTLVGGAIWFLSTH